MAASTFAYYCSGHGYGHATRVSAFTCHLLTLPVERRPTVYIVSSAPERVFSASIALGAHYRYAEIDPVIVQPLAYRVDRQKSIQVLKAFLCRKEALLATETQWLESIKARCVLSDTAFLGCLAAKKAGIPSALITNFTFDSVYSYLATTFVDHSPALQSVHHIDCLLPDIPVPESELLPLVEHIHAGYRCADLLLLLPGGVPIPSFSIDPLLPSSLWVDKNTNRFYPQVISHLLSDMNMELHASIPFPSTSALANTLIPRMIQRAPLLVRPVINAYAPNGRSNLLSSIGVPSDRHDPVTTKILIVSFGGQVFRTPSRSGSRTHSRRTSRDLTSETQYFPGLGLCTDPLPLNSFTLGHGSNFHDQLRGLGLSPVPALESPSPTSSILIESEKDFPTVTSPRIATSSHIWIPGAPPASKPHMSPRTTSATQFSFSTIPPTPVIPQEFELVEEEKDDKEPRLLPDDSWIAIVCGVTKEQWKSQGDMDSELPDGFYLAPRDVYMPDLTAVADVLLGKLGYGTVAECVDSQTPFVYVSRPLFIEEHGLRLLLDNEGVGIELSRDFYEAGDWADAVEEAWSRGKDGKARHRESGGSTSTQEHARQMADSFVDWVDDCWRV